MYTVLDVNYFSVKLGGKNYIEDRVQIDQYPRTNKENLSEVFPQTHKKPQAQMGSQEN